MDTVAPPRNEKGSGLPAPTSLAGTKWTVENPEKRALGEWIEFGRKLRSASDEEILSLIGGVVMYLEDELNDETPPSTLYNYRAYVRGYANTTLDAARAELRKRNSKRPGLGAPSAATSPTRLDTTGAATESLFGKGEG